MYRVAGLALTACFYSSFALASPPAVIIPADGSENLITFTSQNPEVFVYSSANSNESSRVILSLKSTAEISIEANSRKVKRSVSVAQGAAINNGWSAKAISFFAGTSSVSKFRMGGSSSQSTEPAPSPRDPDCSCLTLAEIDELIARGAGTSRESICSFLKAQLGRQDCSVFTDPNGGSSSTVSYQAIGIEMRDTCDSKSKTIVRFKLKPNVDFSQFPQGVTALVGFKSEDYQGIKASSVKPMGEGKIKAPLFLMHTMGFGFGGEKEFVRATSWNSSNIKRSIDLKNGSSDVFYKGLILHRTAATKAFGLGGKAVVDLRSNAGVTYGWCMRMAAVRQKFRYP